MRVGLALLCLTAAPAYAQVQPEVLAVEIGEAGVIEPSERSGPVRPPEEGNMVGSAYQEPRRFIQHGGEIDAKFCMAFGFRFRLPNLPSPLTLSGTIQIDHPVWNRPDGVSGTRERFPATLSQQWAYTGYSLDESWTLVPGTWTFSIMLDDMTLASQSFELKVAPGQSLGTGCEALVS